VFTTLEGFFEFIVMFFGLKNSLATFQTIIMRILYITQPSDPGSIEIYVASRSERKNKTKVTYYRS